MGIEPDTDSDATNRYYSYLFIRRFNFEDFIQRLLLKILFEDIIRRLPSMQLLLVSFFFEYASDDASNIQRFQVHRFILMLVLMLLQYCSFLMIMMILLFITDSISEMITTLSSFSFFKKLEPFLSYSTWIGKGLTVTSLHQYISRPIL